ncbi:hypothetical protein ACFWP7_21310 [Streptomyces sp. NPDC058470]|uniref:hypothetical protein n=1 Tax=Streptomyces sp. NPDC058470 TaxID=3346515 RepID=UPI00365283F7
MQRIQLTYWWNGHEPGDVVELDDATAREVLGVIALPAPESDAEPAAASDTEPESRR